MIYFNSDYLEGAHSAIMARLAETNMMQTIGYRTRSARLPVRGSRPRVRPLTPTCIFW